MTAPGVRSSWEGPEEGVKGRRKSAGKQGEIKGPGPFGSMALMVLRKIRDLALRSGPGFLSFSRLINDLSGTSPPRRAS